MAWALTLFVLTIAALPLAVGSDPASCNPAADGTLPHSCNKILLAGDSAQLLQTKVNINYDAEATDVSIDGKGKASGTTWRVTLSTRYKNSIVEPIMAQQSSPLTELLQMNSCAGIGEPGEGEILMSCRDDEICLVGRGFQTRAESSVAMIREAVNSLQQDGIKIRNFDVRKINIGDLSDCNYDYAYALPWKTADTCRTQLFPDFTFEKWPEAGLLPNFTSLTDRLHDISKNPAEKHVCGWAGGFTHVTRDKFVNYSISSFPSVLEAITPRSSFGTDGGRISMERQAQRWACMLDLPAAGYSGRVPMLLHSGRPLLMVERDSPGHFTDHVWYADILEPGVHYIPVYSNFSNLESSARKALSEEGLNIAVNAQHLAASKLTRAAAIKHIATLLASI